MIWSCRERIDRVLRSVLFGVGPLDVGALAAGVATLAIVSAMLQAYREHEAEAAVAS